jgi:hypothetical protein
MAVFLPSLHTFLVVGAPPTGEIRNVYFAFRVPQKKLPETGEGGFLMKQRIQGMIFGSILTVLILSTVTALGSDGIRNISVTFRNIALVVNGEHITPRDGAGNIVEPFIFNGTTYLPVRAVGEAFGMPVEWDGSTSTVYIGSRGDGRTVVTSYEWLDHMPHLNHQRSRTWFNISAWRPGLRSRDGTAFDRGLIFRTDFGSGDWQSIDVALNANYNTFKGMFVSYSGSGTAHVRIYGDGRLLYTSPIISHGTIPIEFSVDVSNVLLMKIHVESLGGNGHDIGIVEARVERTQ